MADPAPPPAPPKPRSKLPLVLGVAVGVALVEAGVFFAVFKMSGSGPAPAHGEESHVVEGEAVIEPAGIAEVQVFKNFRVPNDKSGRLFIYDVDLSVVVPLAEKEKVETLVKENLAAIGDHAARVIRGASERVLREDDLRALREQLLDALREALGDDKIIQRVLIPRLVPLRSD